MNLPQEQNPTSFMSQSNADESQKTIPLGVGDVLDDAALDPLAGVSEKRKFNGGSLVLVVVIVMACAGMWFMKSLSKVGAAAVGNSDVEASIEKFISSLSGKTATAANRSSNALNSTDANVLAVLSGSYTERQIPLDGVQRNPFIIYGEAAAALGGNTDQGIARRRNERQAQFETAADRLELKSVLMGSRPLANIGGKIVRKGDELVADDLAFRVSNITKDAVTLIGEDLSMNLSMTFVISLKR